MLKVCLIKTSVSSLAEAEQLAEKLVTAKLVACVQISEAGRSLYHWQGELTVESEYYLNLKTAPARCDAAVIELARAHPYELPEIVWSEYDAAEDYGRWVYSEVDVSVPTGKRSDS